jgi:hypothetical protein
LRDRIGDLREHDRHGGGRLLDDFQIGRGSGQDDVWHVSDQLRRVDAGELGIAGIPANIDVKVLAFGPSQLAQCLDERLQI